jgi:hypothetical protein
MLTTNWNRMLVFACVLLGGLTIQHAAAQTYVRGLNQCTRTQWDPNVAALYVVNSCNVPVYVGMTSDSGYFWGGANIGPNSRDLASTFGMGYSPRRDGTVWLFTCPQGDTPAMPGGNLWLPHNYRGEYSCQDNSGQSSVGSSPTYQQSGQNSWNTGNNQQAPAARPSTYSCSDPPCTAR